MYTAVLELI